MAGGRYAEAIGRGTWIGDEEGPRTSVEAQELRSALIAVRDSEEPGGLQMRNCVIRGSLDLSHSQVVVPLSFVDCEFDAPLLLEAATLPAISFARCDVPGIWANGLRVTRDFIVDDDSSVAGALDSPASTHHTAALWLCEADLGGRLLVRHSRIDGRGGRSVQADRMRVGGNIRFLNGSEARGEMRLLSARIAGSIDIVSSQVIAEDETAIELAEAQLGGSIFIIHDPRYPYDTTIDGLVVLSDVKIGAFLRIKGATLIGRRPAATGPFDRRIRQAERVAISAPRVEIGDDLVIDGNCTVEGALLWPRSTILGDVVLNDLTIGNPGDRALDFGGAEIHGSLLGRGLTASGTTWLAGARIGASVSLERSAMSNASGPATLLATGISIAGDLQLDECHVEDGSVRFRAAAIGGEIDARRATLINPGGDTLSLSNASVGGAVQLSAVTSKGLLSINRARVAGRVTFTGASLTCDRTWDKNLRGDALEIISSELRGGLYLDWAQVEPSLDFFSSNTTVVADNVDSWPTRADLSGFSYERFDLAGPDGRSPWHLEKRLTILNSQTPFDLGPYEQAARVFRAHGRISDAEAILIEGRRRAGREDVAAVRASDTRSLRMALSYGAQFASWLYDKSVRFGFRPARALGWSAILVALVWLTLVGPWSGSDRVMRAAATDGNIVSPSDSVAALTTDACETGHVRCFRAGVYAIETVVPLVDLGQRGTWYVRSDSFVGWLYHTWLTFATLLGWTLSTVFLLSFSRIGRSS